MSTKQPTTEPDLDAEREVDIGRYLDALVARWWLPLVGLVVGVALGYLLALGGKEVFRAEATVYVGTPFSPGGSAPVQGLATNPNTVARIARGQETIADGFVASRACPPESFGQVSRPGRSGAVLPRTAAQPALRRLGEGGPQRRGQQGDRRPSPSGSCKEVGGYARLKRQTFQE